MRVLGERDAWARGTAGIRGVIQALLLCSMGIDLEWLVGVTSAYGLLGLNGKL